MKDNAQTRQPFIVGITGGIGSGKTAVSDQLAALGIEVIDADIVAREVVEPGTKGLAAIVEHFGKEVLTANGRLDRAALRRLVFAAPDERKWLEALLHPMIRQTIVDALAKPSTEPYRILASPLLLETDQHTLVDTIVVVDVEPEQQLERAAARDQNTKEQVEAIMKAQIDRPSRLAKANLIVDNRGDLNALAPKVTALHKQLCELATKACND